MQEFKLGCLCRSLAGHDKGHYYITVKEDASYVFLSDGKTKTAAHPKKKKKKHVQMTGKMDEILTGKLTGGQKVYDEEIRCFINKSISEQR